MHAFITFFAAISTLTSLAVAAPEPWGERRQRPPADFCANDEAVHSLEHYNYEWNGKRSRKFCSAFLRFPLGTTTVGTVSILELNVPLR
jgi:hypothetical protein